MIVAGVLYRVTCYERRFVQGMICMCEECLERSDGASTIGTHESSGIEMSKGQDWRRYGQRKLC